MNSTPSRRQNGITLVEFAMVLAVTALSAGAVASSFRPTIERHRIEGTAAQLHTDILYTRSLAVARNQSLRMSFVESPAGSCYVIHTGAANACQCDAQGATACQGTAQSLRTVALPANQAVTVHSNSRSILVDATQGTVTPTATMQVQGQRGETLKVIVNIMGRVRSCATTPSLSGYARC